MGHRRTDSKRRYTCAHLICAYLLTKKITRAVVTARDIAQFHHLSWNSCPVNQCHAEFSLYKPDPGNPFWFLHIRVNTL